MLSARSPRFLKASSLLLALFLAVSAPSCIGKGPYGYSAESWFDLLASGAPLPIPEGETPDYRSLGSLGPGSLLFLAMHAESRNLPEMQLGFLLAAARYETGRYQTRAAELLSEILDPWSQADVTLDFVQSKAGGLIPPERRVRMQAEALLAERRFEAALSVIDAYRSIVPDSSSDPILSALAGRAALSLNQKRWLSEFRLLFLAEGTTGSYVAMSRFLADINVKLADPAFAERIAAKPSPYELSLARARAYTGQREYGAAVLEFRRLARQNTVSGTSATEIARGSETGTGTELSSRLSQTEAEALGSTFSRPVFSDFAKAFLYGSREEGAPGFNSLTQDASLASLDPETAYVRLFWAGRFARAASQWESASRYFGRAAALAISGADLDAALWYKIECQSNISLENALASLREALSRTTASEYYSDLVEPLSRTALLSGNSAALALLDAAVGEHGTPGDRARISYICARAAQLGILRLGDVADLVGPGASQIPELQSTRAFIQSRLARAFFQSSEPWYRLIAAYRLAPDSLRGIALSPQSSPEAFLPDPIGLSGGSAMALSPSGSPTGSALSPPSAIGSALSPSGSPTKDPRGAMAAPSAAPNPSAEPDSAESYAQGLLLFGLASKIRTELASELDRLPAEILQSAAKVLYDKGDYGNSIRTISILFRRQGYTPSRLDRELFWPRPYGPAFAKAALATGLADSLLYGLARSESLFMATAVSSAGAIGLTQLMPATADETARRLRLSDYSLTDAEDNVMIGSTYLKRLIDTLDGRVPPALFSYNAGLSRYRTWAAAVKLPFDLFLETLPFEETRQYGRNVMGASIMYALLYDAGDPSLFAAYILGE